MKIALINIQIKGDNKDYNAGFGTTFQVGNSLAARILKKIRLSGEEFPLISYGYLAAIFKKNGHIVKIFTNEIPDGFDLAIMHCSLIRNKLEVDFLRRIREKTNIKIGLIGPFPSVKPELFLNYADFIISGEPEDASSKIKDQYSLSGIIESRPVMDLDALPFPDWSVFPVKKFGYRPTITRRPFIFLQSSRSCSYVCNYCPYKVFGPYRERSPGNVIEEIEHIVKKYGIRGFMFRDPCFSLNKKRAIDIAEGIIKKGINVEWGCETRLDNLDPELLELMFKSGLRAIKVGIESASSDILRKQNRKPVGLSHQEKIIQFCRKRGIRVIAFYIIGLEGDTRQSIMDTVKYAKRLNTDFANFTICTPIPGTEYYEQVKNRIYEKDWEKFDNFHSVFKHANISGDDLRSLQEKAIVSYYARPKYILEYLIRKLR